MCSVENPEREELMSSRIRQNELTGRSRLKLKNRIYCNETITLNSHNYTISSGVDNYLITVDISL